MSAIFSPCGNYRYVLERRLGEGDKRICWIMLNPSTADAERDDPTIRRCIRFSRDWGYDQMTVVNMWALRATDPRELLRWLRTEPPIYPNQGHIDHEARRANLTIAAWGLIGHAHGGEAMREHLMDGRAEVDLHVLGLTKSGAPRHPLYVAASATPQPWEVV